MRDTRNTNGLPIRHHNSFFKVKKKKESEKDDCTQTPNASKQNFVRRSSFCGGGERHFFEVQLAPSSDENYKLFLTHEK